MVGTITAADITTLLVGFMGFVGVAVGIYFSQKGQRRSQDIDRVAQILQGQKDLTVSVQAEREHALEERDQALTRLEADRQRFREVLHERDETIRSMGATIGELRLLVAGKVAAAAAEVSEEDPHSPEAVARVNEFIRTMKLHGS